MRIMLRFLFRKKSIMKFFILVLLILSLGEKASSQISSIKNYVFGHSLIVHEPPLIPTPSNETTVPHWLGELAKEANKQYTVAGQYGFLPQHRQLPPISQWGFDSVSSAWDDQYAFSSADISHVLLTAGNFVQWQGPGVNYYNDTVSPLSCTRDINDWLQQQEPGVKLYIYENWPDMAPYLSNGFPASTQEFANYNTYTLGTFHDWWIEYHDSILLQRPNDSIRMIPVGPILANLLTSAPLNQIPVDTLYEDDAPHGRPTIYFLSGLITYMALYQEQAPLTYQVPSIIDPLVANNYSSIVNTIWNELLDFNISATGESRVFYGSPPVTTNVGGIDDNNEVEVFPNPFKDEINVREIDYSSKIYLIDILGKRNELTLKSGDKIDLSDYTSGVYFLQIQNSLNNTVKTIKIIKE